MLHRPLLFWGWLTEERCPFCGARDVQPSTHPLPLSRLLRCQTWRCHRCWHRFPLRSRRITAAPASPTPSASRRRPAGEELYALDAALAVLLAPGAVDVDRAMAKPPDLTPAAPRAKGARRPRADGRG